MTGLGGCAAASSCSRAGSSASAAQALDGCCPALHSLVGPDERLRPLPGRELHQCGRVDEDQALADGVVQGRAQRRPHSLAGRVAALDGGECFGDVPDAHLVEAQVPERRNQVVAQVRGVGAPGARREVGLPVQPLRQVRVDPRAADDAGAAPGPVAHTVALALVVLAGLEPAIADRLGHTANPHPVPPGPMRGAPRPTLTAQLRALHAELAAVLAAAATPLEMLRPSCPDVPIDVRQLGRQVRQQDAELAHVIAGAAQERFRGVGAIVIALLPLGR